MKTEIKGKRETGYTPKEIAMQVIEKMIDNIGILLIQLSQKLPLRSSGRIFHREPGTLRVCPFPFDQPTQIKTYKRFESSRGHGVQAATR